MNDIICDVENAIYVIEPKTTEVEITPTKEEQVVIPTDDMLYDKVTVKPIPDDYIIPTGEIELTENKNYDVTSKSIAKVHVKPNVGTKNITENGIYNASDDNLDGYSQVNVQTGGLDEYLSDTITAGTSNDAGWSKTIKKLRSPLTIEGTSTKYMFSNYSLSEFPEIDTSEVTDMSYMYYQCDKGQTISNLNTSKVTNADHMFSYSKVVINCELDMSNVTNMSSMYSGSRTKIPKMNNVTKVTTLSNAFESNSELITLDISHFNTSNLTNVHRLFYFDTRATDINMHFDASKINTLHEVLRYMDNLTNLTFMYNVGKGFSPSMSANYVTYKIDVTSSRKLTHDSLMSIINGLYDIASLGIKTQSVYLGSTNLAKLTSEEIAIATNKGWTVS